MLNSRLFSCFGAFVAALLLQGPSVFGQEVTEPVMTEARLTLRAPGEVLGYWTGNSRTGETSRLQTVPNRPYLAIPKMAVIYERVSPTRMVVHLEKPFRYLYLEGGRIQTHELTEFVVRGTRQFLNKFEKLTTGTVVAHSESNFVEAREFINEMRTTGLTEKMLSWVENRFGPLAAYQLDTVSFDVRADNLLRGESLRLRSITYGVETLVHLPLSPQRDSRSMLGFIKAGAIMDPSDPLIEEYRSARQQLLDRVSSLKFQGWWPARDASGELRRQPALPRDFDFSETRNIEPLALRCQEVYAL